MSSANAPLPLAVPVARAWATSHPLLIQFVRYLAAGGAAFLVDFTCLAILASGLGFNYLVAAAVAFLAGITVNYFASIHWVFDKRSIANTKLEGLLFLATGLVGLAVNELAMWTLTGGLGWFYLHAKLAAAMGVLAWTFSARKWLLFR